MPESRNSVNEISKCSVEYTVEYIRKINSYLQVFEYFRKPITYNISIWPPFFGRTSNSCADEPPIASDERVDSWPRSDRDI